ncbi:MAG: hypothetical protein V1735_00975 [Nanoarchaeota archaeon]
MAVMRLLKRGIFFTLISLMVVSLLIVIYGSTSRSNPIGVFSTQAESEHARVAQADRFVQYLSSSYLEQIVRATSYRSLLALTNYINDNGIFVTNADAALQEAIRMASVNGVPLPEMDDNTLDDRLDELEVEARHGLLLNLSFTVLDVRFYQDNTTGPWQLGVNATINFTVDAELAQWNKTAAIVTRMDITGLEDPYWSAHTDGAFSHIIRPANVSVWDKSMLQGHIRNQTYAESQVAPSFFMRLMDDSGASDCCGIEAIIDFEALPPPLPVRYNMSYVDYCYFGQLCPGSIPNVNQSLFSVANISNASYQFLIEPYHIAFYNLSSDEITQVFNGT